MKNFCLLLLLLLSAQAALAADPPYRVDVEVIPGHQVTIGDEVKLVIKVDHDRNYSFVTPPDTITLAPFEFKRVRFATPKSSGGRVKDSVTLVCTIFDLGQFRIPKIPLTLTDPNGLPIVVMTDEIPIEVKSVLKNDPKDTEMRPIKGPVSVDLLAFYRTLLWPAILVILLTILYFWLRRMSKKNVKSTDVDEQFDATMEALAALRDLRKRHRNIFDISALAENQKSTYHFEKPDMEASDEAMVALLDLQDQKLLADGLRRQFHAELSHIFRHYVGRRYGFPTFEKTTTEIRTLAVSTGVPEDVSKWMHAILDHCDFAKFSPVEPQLEECEQVWKQCWEFVLKTKPAPQPGAETPPIATKRSARSSPQ